MNSYGLPNGPEAAMLDELHRLWGRVFGGGEDEKAPGAGRPAAARVLALGVVVGAIALAAVAWGVY